MSIFDKRKPIAVVRSRDIFANPTAYSRFTRRAFGWRGRSAPAEIRPETETFVPRFVRRHWEHSRHRAKALRIMARYGL